MTLMLPILRVSFLTFVIQCKLKDPSVVDVLDSTIFDAESIVWNNFYEMELPFKVIGEKYVGRRNEKDLDYRMNEPDNKRQGKCHSNGRPPRKYQDN